MTRPRALLAVAAVAVIAAVAALAVALAGGGGAPAPGAPAVLSAGSFATAYPAGWTLTESAAARGSHRYQLSSTGAPVSRLGIPSAGAAAITIDESAPTLLAPRSASAAALARLSAAQLLPVVVGVPRGALAVRRTSAPRRVTLAGAEAAEESYAYRYAGHLNVQADVLARRGGLIVLVELDGEPALAGTSQRGLEAVTAGWRWR